jgi:fumarate hydratase subunit alpha
VGIGGTFETAALLAKKALLRPVGSPNPDPELAALEADWLEAVNNLGIGPQGLGGRITSLAVHIEMMPCHIASLPVAVNIQCHAARHKEAEL